MWASAKIIPKAPRSGLAGLWPGESSEMKAIRALSK